MSKYVDLTNKRFGSLVANRLVLNPATGKREWECICDCGNVCIVKAAYLNAGRYKSCGCKKYNGFDANHDVENLVGFKFGKLMVQRIVGG